jgi:hypothetical protein
MTKSNITQYDNTAANNTDVEDVPLGENLMFPADVNNAFREVMADLADVNDGTVSLTSPSAVSLDVTGNITVGGTVDGRDVATDGTKLDGIEALADVTDTANVTSAGAAMLTGATFTGDVTVPNLIADTVVSQVSINAQTGTTYTTVLSDQSKLVTLSNASAITLTIPANSSVAYPVGTQIDLSQFGAGQVTVAGAGGVTVNSASGLKLKSQYSSASCVKVATDTWLLVGDLEA